MDLLSGESGPTTERWFLLGKRLSAGERDMAAVLSGDAMADDEAHFGGRFADLRRRLSESEGEALAELVASHGLEILDRDVPYILVALRNRLRDRARRDARGHELEAVAASAGPLAEIDPAVIVTARDELTQVLRAMADLEERDRWALWWHAAGYPDQEILAMWRDAGFEPADPTLAGLRQRRLRARARLRLAVSSSPLG